MIGWRDTDGWLRRWISLVGLGAVVYLAGQAKPGFGAAGRPLSLLVLTVVASLAWLAWLAVGARRERLTVAILIVLAGSGAIAGGLSPSSPAVAFAFAAVFVAARLFAPGPAGTVTAVGVIAVLASYPALGRSTAAMIGVSAALIGTWLGGEVLRGNRVRREQAELLLAETRRAQEEHARAAALAERARIAREIHDILAHSLSALAINLEGARVLLDSSGAIDRRRITEQVERARGLAVEGLAETRRAIDALHGDPLPLPELLAALLASDPPDAPIRFTTDGTPHPLTAEAGLAIYRAAQEALTNARKHAPGAAVTVQLDYGVDATTLSVLSHQTATGSPAGLAASGGGYGLTGMRERAKLIGGTVAAGPTPDGWRVTLTVPT